MKRNQVSELWTIPLSKFRKLYTTSKGHKVLGYESRRNVFGRPYRIILAYNEGTAVSQQERYEKEKQRYLSEAAAVQASLSSKRRGRKSTQQSIVRRLNKLIHNGRESVFRYHIGQTLDLNNGLSVWIDRKAEKKLINSFEKQAIFTDIEDWSMEDVVKAYSSKAMIEDDFKFLKDRLLISVMPQWHRKNIRIKVHVFLCIVGLTMYRYLLWKLRDTEMSVHELDKALKEIRIAFVSIKGKERKVQQIVEKMSANSAKVFSKLDMGRYVKG